MSDANSSKAILISALVTCALFFSGFLVILTPLPLMYATVTRGRDAGTFAAVLSAICVAAVYLFALPQSGAATGALAYLPAPGLGLAGFMPAGFVPTFGIGYFAFFVAMSFAFSWGAEKRLPLATWCGYALLAGTGAIVAFIIVAKLFCDGSLIEGANAFILHVLGQIVSTNQSSGFQNAQLMFLTDNTERVAHSILEVLPALMFVYAVIAVAINAVLGRKFIKVRNSMVRVPSVIRFRLSDWLIWALIASGGIFFLNSYFIHSAPLRTAALNGLIGMGVLYFLQGMAVTAYFLQRIKFTLVRTIAYIAIIIFLQTVSVALVVLGIADVWADFRLRYLKMQHQQ
jgi:hypothetical protein